VQEAVKIGLGLATRPTAKEMAPLAEPWRPLRGAAAYLWWSYYRAVKKREGVIGAPEKATPVLNKTAVAKRTSAKQK
jgi:DNA-3-methyladenine glycosylase II